MKPAISHRAKLLPALGEHRGIGCTGRESPQRSRQEDEPAHGPAGLWGSTQAVTTGQFFISKTPTPTPAPLFLLGQKHFFFFFFCSSFCSLSCLPALDGQIV